MGVRKRIRCARLRSCDEANSARNGRDKQKSADALRCDVCVFHGKRKSAAPDWTRRRLLLNLSQCVEQLRRVHVGKPVSAVAVALRLQHGVKFVGVRVIPGHGSAAK